MRFASPLAALAALISTSASGAGPEAPCTAHEEFFDSLAGPADALNDLVEVRWCLHGASVASTSFCPGGNALRLDSATDDPVLWVRVHAPGCSAITLEFQYSQFAATGTVLRSLVSADPSLQCNRAISTSAASLSATGGICTAVSHTLPLGEARSVYWKFDHGSPGSNAIFIDHIRVLLAGCCDSTHGCCDTGAAGCDDDAVRDCVCAFDPYCCRTAWDAQCVAEVTALGCGSCAGGCARAFAADFGTFYQTGTVCARFPGLFESCEGSGPYLTSSLECAGAGDMAMRFGGGFPYASATTHCLALTQPDPALRFSYSKTNATLGPRIEASISGGAFAILWNAPFAPGPGCHEVVLPLDSLAGQPDVRLRFSSGSSVDNGATFDDLELIDLPRRTHDCCTVGAAGCDDAAVQGCVCAIDPYCCEVEWDALCAIGVEYYECGNCGFCIRAIASGFGAAAQPDACAWDPGQFIACQGVAPSLVLRSPCGGAGDAVLRFENAAEGADSAVITACLDLRGMAAASWQFTYAAAPSTGGGPRLDLSLDAGFSYETLWTAPAGGPDCRAACVDAAEAAGRPFVIFRFAGPAGSVLDDVVLVPDEGCRAADLNHDTVVDTADLLALLAAWGRCADRSACPADLDGSGAVSIGDLLALLAAWG